MKPAAPGPEELRSDGGGEPFVPVASELSRRKEAEELALLLTARGIDCLYLEAAGSGWEVRVRRGETGRALQEIKAYAAETAGRSRRGVSRDYTRPLSSAGAAYLFLWPAVMTLLFRLSLSRSGLLSTGVMDAGAVRAGEWHRILSAIFLHSGPGHLSGNLLFGALYAIAAAGRFGPGVAMFGGVLAGAAGNSVHALFSPDKFQSLGASGMVFGLLGLSVASAMRSRAGVRRIAVLLSGAALLGLSGTAPGSDLPGHAAGFVAGILLGLAGSLFKRPGPVRQAVFGGVALFFPLLVWLV